MNPYESPDSPDSPDSPEKDVSGDTSFVFATFKCAYALALIFSPVLFELLLRVLGY
jgi:hypothetical protein